MIQDFLENPLNEDLEFQILNLRVSQGMKFILENPQNEEKFQLLT